MEETKSYKSYKNINLAAISFQLQQQSSQTTKPKSKDSKSSNDFEKRIQNNKKKHQLELLIQGIKSLRLKVQNDQIVDEETFNFEFEKLILEYSTIGGFQNESQYNWAQVFSNFEKLVYNQWLFRFEDCSSKFRGSKTNRSKFVQETQRRSNKNKKEIELEEFVESVISNLKA
jgi:hypothetical protein